MDAIGRHEKKTRVHEPYKDLIKVVSELEEGTTIFNIGRGINYFAANSLLSHWDGFHNDYFLYHSGTRD